MSAIANFSCLIMVLLRRQFQAQRALGRKPKSAKYSITSSARASSVHVERSCCALDDLVRDYDLLNAFEAWQVEHGVEEYSLHDGAQPARPSLAVDGFAGDGAKCFLRHGQLNPLHPEQLLILLHQRVFGLRKDALERGLVKVLERGYDWKPADQFRNQAVFK